MFPGAPKVMYSGFVDLICAVTPASSLYDARSVPFTVFAAGPVLEPTLAVIQQSPEAVIATVNVFACAVWCFFVAVLVGVDGALVVVGVDPVLGGGTGMVAGGLSVVEPRKTSAEISTIAASAIRTM